MHIKKMLSVATLPLMLAPSVSWAISDVEANELIATLRFLKHRSESQDQGMSALENSLN